jgi:hypothetical protein
VSRSFATIAAVLLLVGCSVRPGPSDPAGFGTSSAPARPSPSPSPETAPVNCPEIPRAPPTFPPLPADVDEATRTAVADRIYYGLRFDLDWVEDVAVDPTAVMDFGFPMLPDEAEELFARNGLSQVVEAVVNRYDHKDELGGLYTDHALGGVVVVMWKSDVASHEAAIRPLLPDCHPVLFRLARWSEAELRALQDRIVQDMVWMAEIPASPQGVGAHVSENVVVIDISSANPEAEAMILDHYGAPDGMIRVISDGTGAALLPVGTVVGRVLLANGAPPGPNNLSLSEGSPDDPPGWCGGGIGYGVAPDGSIEIPCKVGRRTIQVMANDADGELRVVAAVVVLVPADARVAVEIRLPAGFDPE